jgi:hypothetical protein
MGTFDRVVGELVEQLFTKVDISKLGLITK